MLTDPAIRNANPGPKPIRLFDGGGLYLEISPAGGKLWRLKYRYAGKEKRLALGTYPTTGLKDARAKRDEAKRILEAGVDPGETKRTEKQRKAALSANSFEVVAREWLQKHMSDKSPSHKAKVTRRLERDVFPYLGRRPVADIKAPEVLEVAQRIERRNILESAHRATQHIGQVMRYAVATGRAEADPTQSLRGALPTSKPKHMAAPTEPAQVGGLLRSIEGFKGGPVVAAALKLLPLLFVRPGELRTMRWEQIDAETMEWRYTTSKTKTEHIVPLSRQAFAILEELRPLTGHLPGGWVFPGGRTPKSPMSDMAINAAYRRLGIDTQNELTGHGWRACARTLLHERLGYAPEIIEHQLAHSVPDALGRAYNRTRFITERRKMMQAWADYLDGLASGANVVPLHGKRAG